MKAVFLDVDDTLVDYDHAARASFRHALGADADYDAFRALDHYESFLAGTMSFEQMRVTRMGDYLALLGRSDDPVLVEDKRLDGLIAHYRLFDDALPCIAALRAQGMQVGLITNNESVHQRTKIRAVGLDGLVDAVVISGEVGVAKPDGRIFAHACAALNVEPRQAMHVGDDLRADVIGGCAAGLRAVWLNRQDRAGAPAGTEIVRSLAEVPALVHA